MTRFSFAKCEHCGRLNIHGARCVCNPLPEIDCDCEGGNQQTIGPKCAARRQAAWRESVELSRDLARQIKDSQS